MVEKGRTGLLKSASDVMEGGQLAQAGGDERNFKRVRRGWVGNGDKTQSPGQDFVDIEQGMVVAEQVRAY